MAKPPIKGALDMIGSIMSKKGFKQSQDPRLAKALEDYLKGDISEAERIAAVRELMPIRPITSLPPNYSDADIINSLTSNKQAKALAPIETGSIVGNRLDIPAYESHGVYIDTTHRGVDGPPISYGRTGHLKGVTFGSNPNKAVRVGLGTKPQALTPMGAEMGSGKSPFATISGTHQGTSDEEVRRMAQEYLRDPEWAQIGMNPYRHSQFYDKADMSPVWSAEEKLQVGPLVLVPRRGLEKTHWGDPRLNLENFPGKRYAQGGLAHMSRGKSVTDAAKAAYKKLFTPGFYHASPSNKIKEFDPDAPARHMDELSENGSRGATFFTKSPTFAESFLPLKSLAVKDQYETGATMYPVSLNLGKHFDPTKPENFQVLKEYTNNPSLIRWLNRADWSTMEQPEFLDFLKRKGYDSFTTIEGGTKNVGVFDPKNIRGKFAQFNPEDAESADFMKADGGLIHLAAGGKTPAWQRKEGKNPEGGLNAAGRASYNRETGGNLKAPQPEGGARRDSFCARMKGMKKKLTSAETANDPDSRINKSLRKWKC